MKQRDSDQATEHRILGHVQSAGQLLGHFAGHPIYSVVIDQAEQHYNFLGVASCYPDGKYDLRRLKPGEFILDPGLIYRPQGYSVD